MKDCRQFCLIQNEKNIKNRKRKRLPETVMKLSEIHKKKKNVLSFEIFPPKKDEELKNIDKTLEILCELNPDFISVTFGAGGSTNNNKTVEILWRI